MNSYQQWLDNQAEETQSHNKASKNPYVEWLEEQAPQVTKADVQQAVSKNPDERAKALSLAAQSGLPADVVERNYTEIETHQRSIKLHNKVQGNQFVAGYFSKNPETLNLAHDDIDVLTRVGDVARSVPAGAGELIGRGTSGLGDLNAAAGRFLNRGIEFVSPDMAGLLRKPVLPWWANPTGVLQKSGDELDRISNDVIMPPSERQNFATDVGKGLGQMAAQVALTLVNPSSAAVMNFGVGADEQADRVEKQGVDSAAADLAVFGGGALSSVMEKLPIDFILDKLPVESKNKIGSYLWDISKSAGAEGLQEVVEGISQNVLEYVAYNPDAEIVDWAEAAYEGGVGATVGGLARSIVLTAMKGRQYVDQKEQDKQINERLNTLKNLQKDVEQSKLGERSLEHLEAYVNEATEDAQVYMDSDRAKELFQSIGPEEAQELMQKMDLSAAVLEDAAQIGSQVAVPVSKLVTAFKGTSYLEVIAPDLAFEEHGDTMRQLQEVDFALADAVQESFLELEAEQSQERENSPEDLVFTRVKEQLLKTGMAPDTARNYSVLHRGFAKVLQDRYGIDPVEYYEQTMNLQVRRQVRNVPQKVAQAPYDRQDLIIDRMLSGNRVKVGQPILEYLKKMGVSPDSVAAQELRAVGLTNKTHVGLFKRSGVADLTNIVREQGTVFELLPEDGSGNNYVDRDALLEAISNEVAGNPLIDLETQQHIDDLDTPADDLAQALDEAGIDWQSMTREQIKEVINQQDFEGEKYDQFAGENAYTADIHSLNRAKELLAQDRASGESVRRKTGWHLGVDGKWRFEIPDNEAKINDQIFSNMKISQGYDLESILNHPKLYAAYPDLRYIPVYRSSLKEGLEGYVDMEGLNITLSKDLNSENLLSVLLHEVQHIIQKREKFARGGNDKMAERVRNAVHNVALNNNDVVTYWKNKHGDVVESAKSASKLARKALMFQSYKRLMEYSRHNKPSGVFRHIRNELNWLHSDVFREEGAPETLFLKAQELYRKIYNLPKPHKMEERNAFLRNYSADMASLLREAVGDDFEVFANDKRQTKSLVKAFQRESEKARKQLEPLRKIEEEARRATYVQKKTSIKNPYQIYQSLAGEIEARNTQKRLSLTEEERRHMSPEMTQDISSTEAIVIGFDGEVASPMIANVGRSNLNETLSLYQTGPVTNLKGDELGIGTAGELRPLAKVWFKENLQGRVIPTALGDVRITGKGIKKFLANSADVRKLQMVPALETVLRNGQKQQTIDVSADNRSDNIVRFHRLNADVSLGGKVFEVSALIGEDVRGKLFYNLNPDVSEIEKASDNLGLKSQGSEAFEQGDNPSDNFASELGMQSQGAELSQQGNKPYESNIPNFDGGFNIKEKGEARGSIVFGDDQTIINLFDQANASTFIHESGHFFLESLKNIARENEQAAKDLTILQDWFGTTEVGVEQHEQFARGFELYIREGEAPSSDLAAVFETLANWLVYIYRTARGLNVSITDDVRHVMDRMIATDEEISKAKALNGIQVDPAIMEMASETDRKALQKAADVSARKAKERVRKREMRNLTAAAKKERKDLLEEMTQEVMEQLRNEPVWRAFDFFTGEQPAGMRELSEDDFYKLDRAQLLRDYGEEGLKQLPRKQGTVYRQNGVDPDVAARMFGFDTGEELVMALMNIKGKNLYKTAREQAEILADERLGTLEANLESIGREAAEAIVSNESAAFIEREAQIIADQAKLPLIKKIVMKKAVSNRLASLTMGEAANVSKWIGNERKAWKAVATALKKGDFAEAHAQKQRQLFNYYMAVEAKKIRKERNQTTRYLERMTRKKVGKTIIEPDHMQQIKNLTYAYGFGTQKPDPEVASQYVQLFNAWLEGKAKGDEAILYNPPADLVVDGLKAKKEMTRADYRQLHAIIKNLEHVGTKLSKDAKAAEKAQFESDVQTLINSDDLPFRKDALNNETEIAPTLGQKARNFVEGMDAGLLKVRQIVQWLDGDNAEGAWHKLVMTPIDDAINYRDKLEREYTAKFMSLVEAMPKEWRDKLNKQVKIAQIKNQKLSHENLISFALNVGNEGNLEKLMKGYNMTDADVQTVLERLDGDDWKFVQDVWDMIDGLFPELNAVHRRITGVELPKVEANPFTVMVDGQEIAMRGGYYPVMYDPKQSKEGEQFADKSTDLFENTFSLPVTVQGHTKQRTGFHAPILLDFSVIPEHMSNVINDIALRETVRKVDKLTQNNDVNQYLKDVLGANAASLFRPWLQSIANDRALSGEKLKGWERLIKHLRTSTTMMAMGYKVSTVIAQIGGVPAALDYFAKSGGRRYYYRAIKTVMSNPITALEEAKKKSGILRNRQNNMDRDLRDVKRQMLNTKIGKAEHLFKAHAFSAIGYIDGYISTAVWWGAYNQAIDEGKAERGAIQAADNAVNLTQGSGSPQDLAAIQRQSNELMKLVTMFYSYFSALYNRQRDIGRQFMEKGLENKIIAAERFLYSSIIPAILGELLLGRFPDEDDDETWVEWFAVKVGTYPFASIPFVRDVVNGFATPFGYSFTPADSAGASFSKFFTEMGNLVIAAIDGDEDVDGQAVTKAIINAAGYSRGLPLGQAQKTIDAIIEDLEEGDVAWYEYLFGVKR